MAASADETRTLVEVGYGSFLYCGLVTLSVGILDFIPKEDTTAALLGFFVFIPAVGLGIGAVLLGTLLSIRLSGHPALVRCPCSRWPPSSRCSQGTDDLPPGR